MRTLTEFLLATLVFAVLAVLGHRWRGPPALVVLALGWMAAVSVRILATVPGPEVSLHDFERTPVPALAAVVAGTVAATAFVWTRKTARPPAIRVLSTAGVYLAAAVPADVILFFWYMGG